MIKKCYLCHFDYSFCHFDRWEKSKRETQDFSVASAPRNDRIRLCTRPSR